LKPNFNFNLKNNTRTNINSEFDILLANKNKINKLREIKEIKEKRKLSMTPITVFVVPGLENTSDSNN